MTFELIIGKSNYKSNFKKKIYLDKQILNFNNEIEKNDNINHNDILVLDKRVEIQSLCNDLYEKIILDLAKKLNHLHGVNFSDNFWKITLGPWLSNFIAISFNRYHKIKRAIENKDISSVLLFENVEEFIPLNNFELNKLCNDNNWNAIFYSHVINFLKPELKEKINKIEINRKKKRLSLKNLVKKYIFSILTLFYKKKDPIITSTYLPFFENLKLFFYLKQIPIIWFAPILERDKINLKNRKLLLLNQTEKNFENFLKNLIPFSIPICHIELFKEMNEKLRLLKLPENPKFIYTTNNYEYDEYFKLYVALKKENKTKYIIGQHGNISWIEDIFFENQHSADHYLYWGKDGFGKNENGFNFKLKRKFQNKSKGYLLILDSPFGTNNKIFNRIDENFEKEESLKILLTNLEKNIKENIIFKLHSSFDLREKNYIEKLKKICPKIKIETSNQKTSKLVQNSKCVLHLYDSTGILETMSYNVPTLCMWQNEFNHIQKKYHNLYYALKKNEIFFNEPLVLSEHINKNWNDVQKWWLKENIQSCKKFVLNELSIFPDKNSTYKLSKKLLELSS